MNYVGLEQIGLNSIDLLPVDQIQMSMPVAQSKSTGTWFLRAATTIVSAALATVIAAADVETTQAIATRTVRASASRTPPKATRTQVAAAAMLRRLTVAAPSEQDGAQDPDYGF